MDILVRLAAIGILGALGVGVLVIAQDILVPFVVAGVLWYIILLLWQWLRGLLPRRRWAHWATLAVACGMLVVGLLWLYDVAAESIGTASESAGLYQARLVGLVEGAVNTLGLKEQLGGAEALLHRVNMENLVIGAAGQLAAMAGMASVVAVYVAFFAVEYHTFGMKLRALVPSSKRYAGVVEVLHTIHEDIKSYLRIMTISSFVTAVLSYLLLLAVGVDFAGLWMVIIFFTNYLATLGSLLGVVLPAAFAALQFGEIAPVAAVAAGLALVQGVVGNVVEPRLMGKSLNLSPLAILLALAVWGEIWGLVGMLLSIPITAAISVVCARFPATRGIAVLLSEEGEVPSPAKEQAQ